MCDVLFVQVVVGIVLFKVGCQKVLRCKIVILLWLLLYDGV